VNDKFILIDGEPVVERDLMTWARWFERANRRVAETFVGKARVSSVFLGIDHSFGSGPPLIFETMIFGGRHDQYQARYSTRLEAERGHAAAVKLATPWWRRILSMVGGAP